MKLPWLNYHHLLYFRTIAREGGVNRAAEALGLSQSTLSAQLKDLETSLGTPLFHREGRRLVLTEAGQTALEYAEDIFDMGDELRSWFASQHHPDLKTVRIGTTGPLSKVLQFEILRPLAMAGETKAQVIQNDYSELIDKLKKHQLDIVLSNLPLSEMDTDLLDAHLLGEMPVYLVGRPPFKIPDLKFPKWLEGIPVFLPSSRTSARMDFDALMTRAGIKPQVQAEVDDTGLLRMLSLSGAGLALVPEIGVQFELSQRKLLRIEKVPKVKERFYAITTHRKKLPPQVNEIIETAKQALLTANEKMRERKV
ncbi:MULTISPECIES: LysR family transcriptional regulator [unclassified Lentimonas]|uniref:LysR family transcriptional regulator n=1 Tax=unclassified Lentimonas TaxID=2630993 RepID=UPI00132389FF|nr:MULTISPECIES: LysR family transcriptional regulator [unclassified Lentimonas]CAA6678941.1 Unannotated [Lentimonas sp. CC4]CAA6687431.1 Unannotated [Lentimonas sp. CC6]CAA7075180.1 Unannotated [Lentimonas sp. CC4]CAA7172080.1 Unannotated [Lentimonas sp. CC21]CAA7180025.1 Unannotated [Lentimonas sp. CC8]